MMAIKIRPKKAVSMVPEPEPGERKAAAMPGTAKAKKSEPKPAPKSKPAARAKAKAKPAAKAKPTRKAVAQPVAKLPKKKAKKKDREMSARKSAMSRKGLSLSGRKLRSCLCGCGGKTADFFMRGHVNRLRGWLKELAQGGGKPTDYMSAELAKALGPWTPKGKGVVPSKSYVDLR